MDNFKILVVDTNEETREFLIEGIEKNHPETKVYGSTSMNDTDELLNRNHYEVILCRYGSNDIDTISLIGTIRTHSVNKAAPIIVITDIDNKDNAQEMINIGAYACLVEPFSVEKVIYQILVVNEKFNRRGAFRYNVNNPVLLKFHSNYAEGTLIDISMTGLRGIFLFHNEPPKILDEVVLNIEYENEGKVFEVKGRIVRKGQSETIADSSTRIVAAKFIDMTADQEEQLSLYIKSLN